LHGDGSYIRDWIYVKDNVDALYFLIEKKIKNQTINIGAKNHLTNLQVVKSILKEFDKTENEIIFVANRWGQDLRYSLNIEKIKNLGWSPNHYNGIFKWWN
jgi:dTDP-glucose 4,6-dehydratase